MTILIASGKSLKLEKSSDKFYLKDVYGSNDLAPLSAGCEKMEKGFLLKDWTCPFHDAIYLFKGFLKVEAEGKTYVAHEGDFLLITKDSKVTMSTDEETEAFFVSFPSHREAGKNW
ncbi:hypothetical protein ACFLWT_01570 [Chloroflexota bacterium]